MTTTTFEVNIPREDVREFNSFEEAFKHLYGQVGRRIDEYSITLTEISENCSLITPSGYRFDYFSAIKEAINKGIFKNGKLAENTSDSDRSKPVPVSSL